jgi:tryptophan synthase alpha chain
VSTTIEEMSATTITLFGTKRIDAAFEKCRAEGRIALLPYVTGGYPTLAQTETLIYATVDGGADLLEIGIPFSDPLADGATVQHTSQVALEGGTTLTDCLDLVRRVRAAGVTIPLVMMGYSNPFYQYGLERLARDAAEAGVDGFIVPDLPIEESDEFREPFAAAGLSLIYMLAPTSTDTRIAAAGESASGFIYCVSLVGVTGARDHVSDELPAYLARVRSQTDVPLVVGFGISRPEHVQQMAAVADGVVVASALINRIKDLPIEEQAGVTTAFVREMAAATVKSSTGGSKGNAD